MLPSGCGKANLIANGEVDERSVEQVEPADLRGFTQCHFFAGIGVWSYALRAAGWSDDTPVWTGSCPCQSFSQSGKGEGFSDKRHLWPSWFRLISECQPATIFGEQVASKDGRAWYDVVSADMEGAGYAIGEANLGAHSVGAPHIRQRLFFVAESEFGRLSRRNQRGLGASWSEVAQQEDGPSAANESGDRREDADFVAHAEHAGLNRPSTDAAIASGNGQADGIPERSDSGLRGPVADATERRREQWDTNQWSVPVADENCPPVNMGHPASNGSSPRLPEPRPGEEGDAEVALHPSNRIAIGATNGFWRDAEWIYCKDGKWRPTKPGLPVLVNGTPNRVGRLRGFGNAINAEVAKAFIEAYMELD